MAEVTISDPAVMWSRRVHLGKGRLLSMEMDPTPLRKNQYRL